MSKPLITPPLFYRKPLALLISGLITGGFSASSVSQENSSPSLEEIIVTAQKRAENLQEVPISVAAISGEKLEKAGVENIQDLTSQVPNIHFTETGISTQVRVRGIGSDNSQGFEQSVGMYVDGIFYGRAQLFRTPMMDMERAEVLRGPQGTLFGKNSISGALNLTTARPTDEFEGSLSYSNEFKLDQKEANFMLSGPLIDNTLKARLAVRHYEEDGYMENAFLGEDQPSSEEKTVRVSVDYQATDELNFFLKAEQNEFDVQGRPIEILLDEPLPLNGEGDADLVNGTIPDNATNYQGVLSSLVGSDGSPIFDTEPNYVRHTDFEERSNNDVNNYTLIANYDIGEYTLTATTGWLEYEYDELCDCDFVAAEILNAGLGETYEQLSQEIRIASPAGRNVEWIAGVYYQDYEQTFYDRFDITATNVLAQGALFPQIAETAVARDFNQSSTAYALFSRATWHITEKLGITIGARYTEEKKEADKIVQIFDRETNQLLDDSPESTTIADIYLQRFLIQTEQSTGHKLSGEQNESKFLPLLNIEFKASDDFLVYGSYTEGYKAPGFDPRSNNVNAFEFEGERADAFELGFKSTLANGRGELNLALFRTNYQDLQISQFDGAVGFNVGNAEETLVQGIEIDGRWALTEELIASYGISFLDFEYLDFRNGNCHAGQLPDASGVDLNDDNEPDTCDYTGKRGVYTPEYTLNFSLDYARQLNNHLAFTSLVDVQYVDEQMVHVNLDKNGLIDPYTLLSIRLGLEGDKWSVALLGKNLLDEYVETYRANAPLSESNFKINTHYGFANKPRTIALEGKIKF